MTFSINDIKEIISTISVYNDMDYSNYVFSFLKRRYARIYESFNIKNTNQFYDLLKSEMSRDMVIGEMLVDTGEMFRDPSFWKYIRDEILVKISKIGTTIWLPNETGKTTYSL